MGIYMINIYFHSFCKFALANQIARLVSNYSPNKIYTFKTILINIACLCRSRHIDFFCFGMVPIIYEFTENILS